MSCSPSARGVRLVASTALAGAVAVTGPVVIALPAVAAPVAIDGYVTEIPEGAASTGPEYYINPVTLSNGDTAYGVHEGRPMAPVGEPVLDDDSYAPAEPFDDVDAGWTDVVGEKVADQPVYWEAEEATLAAYILSVFGATEDGDEALAVHWAVRSLSTAAAPAPELSGLEQSHLDRAEVLIDEARANVSSATPQSGYAISVSFEPSGRPDTLLLQMPEIYFETTVTLSGPVTFADGTSSQTFTGGEQVKYVRLAVPAGVTEGELTASVAATMPSTELTVLADDEYRDLFIAGQDRTLTWSASAAFEVVESTAPDSDPPGEEIDEKIDAPEASAPADDHTGADGSGSGDSDTGVSGTPGADGFDRQRSTDASVVTTDVAAEPRTTALIEAFVLFEETTTTHTEVVTETTTTSGGALYADPVMADTGMGAARPVSTRSGTAPALLALIAVAAGLGSWMLRRRKPSNARHLAAVS